MDKWLPAIRVTGIGFYIATCIVGGTLAGWWLGGKRPLFMIIGLLVGLFLAVYGTYRMIKPLIKNNQDKENGHGGA
ncbi:MAG: AtpZ/AtpI family protein [Dehalococcoidales bacterium]|jgi:F0F1-type ATP synthase assembly protein I